MGLNYQLASGSNFELNIFILLSSKSSNQTADIFVTFNVKLPLSQTSELSFNELCTLVTMKVSFADDETRIKDFKELSRIN